MFIKHFHVRPLMLLCTLSLISVGVMADQPGSQLPQVQSAARPITSLNQALPAGVSLYNAAQLNNLYRQHSMQPLWNNPQATRAFEKQLAEVALAGINPQFSRWLAWLGRDDVQGIGKDIILSDAFLSYMQFVSQAPAHGDAWFYGQSRFQPSAAPGNLLVRWQQALQQGSETSFVQSLAPLHPAYLPMQRALVALLADKQPWPQLNLNRSLRPGDSDASLADLRKILVRGGWLTEQQAAEPAVTSAPSPVSPPPSAPSEQRMLSPAVNIGTQATPSDPAAANSFYSENLVDAVKRFQRWQGLHADGVVGLRTRQWLNTTPGQRATLLALNMQRLRLLPDDMHNGIMVNIANYSLNYYVDGKTILNSKVIVGRPERKTPLMRSALNSVVLNPTWTVPNTIIRQDLVPKLKQNPAYLSQHNYVLISGWSADAVVVDPATVDWQTVSANAFPYRVQQAAGPQNSLGRYKFNMPSSEAIYLHDTPNHGLFQQDIRAISSGCVRVNQAAQLASLLLKDVGWDQNRISQTLAGRTTRPISIRHRIPVNLYYLTAWTGEDGKARFRTDIYNYDQLASYGQSAINSAEKFLL